LELLPLYINVTFKSELEVTQAHWK